MKTMREEVFGYIQKKYKAKPEYLWAKFPEYAVFRHADNQKWFGLVMNISYDKINRDKSGMVDILNVKLDDILLRELLLQQDGYYVGYHISRGNWISIVLDGTVLLDAITHLIDVSYSNLIGDSFDKTYDGFVCRDNMGKLITPAYVTTHFKLMVDSNGLKHLRFHDLRHSCASLLVASGVPVAALPLNEKLRYV